MGKNIALTLMSVGMLIAYMTNAVVAIAQHPPVAEDADWTQPEYGVLVPIPTYEEGLAFVEEKTSEPGEVGFKEVLRVEGPVATFIRLDWGGSMNCTSALYFVYRDGGVRELDLGIYCGIAPGVMAPSQEMRYPRFSTDGKVFSCTVIVSHQTFSNDTIYNEAGCYFITVDVESGRYIQEVQELPVDMLPGLQE